MYPMNKQENTTIGFVLLALIAQPEVIGKILVHVGLWPAAPHSPQAWVSATALASTGRAAA